MKITTRLEISASDENEFMDRVAAYVSTAINTAAAKFELESLIKFHRQQMNAAFRLGLNERIRKESKD